MTIKQAIAVGLVALYANEGFGQAHPWVVASPRTQDPFTPVVYFTNLQDGQNVESPVVVRVGLSLWGLAPADINIAKTGHHHLLINTDLPKSSIEALPFNDNYRHMGKGQLETIVNLPEGKHSLRLLLADHKHIPNGYVFSKKIYVNVVGKTAQPYVAKDSIELLSPRDGAEVAGPFLMQFHASGAAFVGHAQTTKKDTGYFVLQLTPEGRRAERIEFTGGQTETWLRPPPGRYTAQLLLVKPESGQTAFRSESVRFTVKS